MSTIVGDYESVRSHIATGDVVYFRDGTSLASKVTQFVTRSPHFHVGIAFWIRDPQYASRLMLLEAHAGGRRIVSLSSYEGHRMDVVRFDNNWLYLCNTLLDNTGRVPYGYLDYITIGIKEVFGLKKYVTRKVHSVRGEVCSELSAVYINASGFRLPTQLSPGAQFRELMLRGIPVAIQVNTVKK